MVGRHQQLIFFHILSNHQKLVILIDSCGKITYHQATSHEIRWLKVFFWLPSEPLKAAWLLFPAEEHTHRCTIQISTHSQPWRHHGCWKGHSAAIESCNRCPVTTHSWSLEEFPAKTPQDPRHPQLIRMFIEYRNEILEDMILCEVNPEQDAGWKRDLMDVDGFRLSSFSSKLNRSWSLGVL